MHAATWDTDFRNSKIIVKRGPCPLQIFISNILMKPLSEAVRRSHLLLEAYYSKITPSHPIVKIKRLSVEMI